MKKARFLAKKASDPVNGLVVSLAVSRNSLVRPRIPQLLRNNLRKLTKMLPLHLKLWLPKLWLPSNQSLLPSSPLLLLRKPLSLILLLIVLLVACRLFNNLILRTIEEG
jgi:hypothetical protein